MSLFTLKKNKEFRKVYNVGKSVADRYLVLYSWKRPDTSVVKFGFSISKKVGNAVVRNSIRRRLKEICRLNQEKLQPGIEIIIIARNPVASINYAEMQRSFWGLAKRAKLIVQVKDNTHG